MISFGSSLPPLFFSPQGPVGTPYEGHFFELKLVLSSDFPNSPPRGFFLTRIYHPNVASNGDICVNTLKKDWTVQTTISHVLSVIRCLLIVPFPESSLNDEAGKLFMESYEEYSRRAKLMAGIHARKASSTDAAADTGGGGVSGGGGEVKNDTSSDASKSAMCGTATEAVAGKKKKSASTDQKKKEVSNKKKNLKRL